MNYEMSEHDSDWNGPMSDPNTGGTLEQIQKEQREAFEKEIDGWTTQKQLEDFNDESIRIAYEAGYRTGLDRAKELVPEDVKNHYGQLAEGYNQLRDKILSLLDYEIAKHPL